MHHTLSRSIPYFTTIFVVEILICLWKTKPLAHLGSWIFRQSIIRCQGIVNSLQPVGPPKLADKAEPEQVSAGRKIPCIFLQVSMGTLFFRDVQLNLFHYQRVSETNLKMGQPEIHWLINPFPLILSPPHPQIINTTSGSSLWKLLDIHHFRIQVSQVKLVRSKMTSSVATLMHWPTTTYIYIYCTSIYIYILSYYYILLYIWFYSDLEEGCFPAGLPFRSSLIRSDGF